MKKIVLLILSLVCLFFAYLQHNDADGHGMFWTIFYLGAACVGLARLCKLSKISRILRIVLIITCVVLLIILTPKTDFAPGFMRSESLNEWGGVVITLLYGLLIKYL